MEDMNMLKTRASLWTLILAGVLVSASGCSSGTMMKHSWLDPGYAKKPIKKVMVIGLGKDESMRRVFESQMSAIFQKEGVSAVPSYTIMPDLMNVGDEAAAREVIGEAVVRIGADAVTITRMLSAESVQTVVPGSTYVVPGPYYRGFYGFYAASYQVVSTPGYIVEDKTYVVESNLYDVATEKLIWTGVSETLNPDSAVKGIESVGQVIVYTLKEEGLISK